MMTLRPITPEDDRELAAIIRKAFVTHHLDIPGTAYFDPELDHLSSFYNAFPDRRSYLILEERGRVSGGVGVAEFSTFPDTAEMQKLYLSDEVKGKGYGKLLVSLAEKEALRLGYGQLYIETHSNFSIAVKMYSSLGFERIEKPSSVQHDTMNTFFIRKLH